MTQTTLHIQDACSQKWNELTSATEGKFCSHCQRVVVDFTEMSDVEIVDYFSHASGRICGRLHATQLKAYTQPHPAEVHAGLGLFKAGILSFLFLLTSKQLSAQSISSSTPEVVQRASDSVEQPNALSAEHMIRGIVKSKDDKSELPGVEILLQGTSIGTNTNRNGWFEFPKKLFDGDVLEFRFIGFETQKYRVRKSLDMVVEIEMILDASLMGEVVVDGPYAARPSGFKKMWWHIKDLF